jgi:hypothetical protein
MANIVVVTLKKLVLEIAFSLTRPYITVFRDWPSRNTTYNVHHMKTVTTYNTKLVPTTMHVSLKITSTSIFFTWKHHMKYASNV